MAKQIYIDGNGNEQLVSGTINTADMLPIESGSATNTKDYIDSGLSGKADSSNVYTKTQIDAMLPKIVYTNLDWENQHSFVADINQVFICYTDSTNDCAFIRIYSNGTVSFKVISGTVITGANFTNQRLYVNTNNKGLIAMRIA